MRGRNRTAKERWQRAHGNKDKYTLEVAEAIAEGLNTVFPDALKCVVFECVWSDWYWSKEEAPLHYHIGKEGHGSRADQAEDPSV